MKPHFSQNLGDPFATNFPSLPILSADETKRLSTREKYGALFYLGIGGLAILVALVAWFGVGVWTLWPLWTNVYILHDPARPEAERIAAAYTIARDPNANQLQRWDIGLERNLPPLSRYVIAESLDAEAAEADPRGYGLAVSKSEGWPNWLRLLLTRPMTYAAAAGQDVSTDGLKALSKHPDPAIGLWADCSLAMTADPDPSALRNLRAAAESSGSDRELALLLLKAVETKDVKKRLEFLDSATLRLRTDHAESAKLWDGYKVDGGRLVPSR